MVKNVKNASPSAAARPLDPTNFATDLVPDDETGVSPEDLAGAETELAAAEDVPPPAYDAAETDAAQSQAPAKEATDVATQDLAGSEAEIAAAEDAQTITGDSSASDPATQQAVEPVMVRLLVARAGVGISQNRGDVVPVSAAEAIRMIEAGQAMPDSSAEKPEAR